MMLRSSWVGLRVATKVKERRLVLARGLSGCVGVGSDPWITATPRVCLHDVPTTLTAGGLTPHAPVTLYATLTDEKGKEYCSCAHYMTDATGSVNTRKAESVGGSYEGVFPAGLLTTLTPAPHESPFLRLHRRDTSLPWKIQVSVLDAHQPLGAKVEAMAKVELERHLVAPGVRRLPVREGRVRGTLYLPPGEGPFPGVIDMFGLVGGLMEFRSAMLASRGFASLALAYFFYDDLPITVDNLDLSYFEEAVEVLLASPGVVPDRCGAIGNSGSGQFLLSMATLISSVKAVVGINCSILPFESNLTYKGKLFKEGYVMDPEKCINVEGGIMSINLGALSTVDNPSMIPVEEADDETHFLMIAGADDPWRFDLSVQSFRERMLRHDRHNFETVLYPGAGHIIEPPYCTHIKHSLNWPLFKKEKLSSPVPMAWGGNPKSTCAAQEDLWQRIQTLWMTHVRDESPWYQEHLTRPLA